MWGGSKCGRQWKDETVGRYSYELMVVWKAAEKCEEYELLIIPFKWRKRNVVGGDGIRRWGHNFCNVNEEENEKA